jgi:LmbE family N-acetylglucosaminyl deacetylase
MMHLPSPLLVVAAHPDDEALGCGGTMAKAAAAGVSVHTLFFTNGVGARDARNGTDTPSLADERASAAHRALRRLGAGHCDLLDFPDNRLDTVALLDLAQQVEAVVERVRPAMILTHHADDLNVDHRCVHEAVMTACRPQPGHEVQQILCFEVASSTEWRAPRAATAFVPQLFVDISSHLTDKLAALQEYEAEMRPWPHARSIEALGHLARWRGATVGVEAAEAFMVARMRL